MDLCFDCQRETALDGGEDEPYRWQFKTVEGPCERCGNTFAHRQIHP